MGQGQSKISAQDKAILQLKNQRDKLRQYQRRITIVAEQETEVARECLRRGDKPKALVALRRKKYQESMLANTDQHLATLEKLVGDVEFAVVQVNVLHGLKQGTDVLKKMHKEIGGIEGVQKLLGDAVEAQEYTKEVSELLAGRMSNQGEDEVEEEMAALDKEVNGAVAEIPAKVPEFPDVPTIELPDMKAKKLEQKERWEKRRLEQQGIIVAA